MSGQDAEEVDPDAEEMKALRSWMMQVNTLLHSEGVIDYENRQELHDKAMRATGWDDDE